MSVDIVALGMGIGSGVGAGVGAGVGSGVGARTMRNNHNNHTNLIGGGGGGSVQTQKMSRRRKRDLWDKIDASFIDDSSLVEAAADRVTQTQTGGTRDCCDVCKTAVVITDEGFMVCANPKCSIIYTDVLDHSAEWRYYGADSNQHSDPTRCGMPVNPLLVESSYGCKVLCDGPSTYEMRKIRRYSEWQAMPYKEKSQYDEFQRITIVGHNNDIPKIIIDEALRHHKRISEHKTFRGLNRDGVIAASVYVACRIHNCPRTAKEIATIFSLDITSATRGCKNALVIINELECDMVNSDKTAFCKTTPNAFIDRYCSRLNMNGELTQVCLFVAARIEKRQLIPENTPHSIAAGIVYFIAQSCGLNISKHDVNRVSEISEVTINKCFKKLDAHIQDLIPKSIIAKYTRNN
jgi:transcription initiation factor TFIIB